MWLSELYYLCNAKYVLDNRPFYSIFCHVADPHLLWAMPSSKRTIGAPHLMLPMMVASSMMQNPFMWSSTPATNSDKKKKKKQKKDQEKKPNHVIKGNTTCSNPSMWTTPHVQPLSYVSDGPPSLAQQVDQKLRTIENQFAIASGYSLTSFPSTSTFRRHWVCKSPCKGIFCSRFQNLCHFPCIFAIVNICESHE